VVKRLLFRTQNIYDSTGNPVQGYADQFFFHSEIPDNVTTQIIDGLLDSNLGTPVDELDYGPWPTNAKYIAPFKGCMFATGSTQTDVFYSAPNAPENFPIDNVLPVGDAYLGPITGLYGTRNALVVFKEHGIYFIKGDPVTRLHRLALHQDDRVRGLQHHPRGAGPGPGVPRQQRGVPAEGHP
jgi:hypothetical protein